MEIPLSIIEEVLDDIVLDVIFLYMIEVWQKLFPVVSFLELMEGHHI